MAAPLPHREDQSRHVHLSSDHAVRLKPPENPVLTPLSIPILISPNFRGNASLPALGPACSKACEIISLAFGNLSFPAALLPGWGESVLRGAVCLGFGFDLVLFRGDRDRLGVAS
jgi:hypothetical protein